MTEEVRLDAPKTSMERCLEAIEANNAKYPAPLPRKVPVYPNGYICYNPKHGEWYRNMKEQRDAWDY